MSTKPIDLDTLTHADREIDVAAALAERNDRRAAEESGQLTLAFTSVLDCTQSRYLEARMEDYWAHVECEPGYPPLDGRYAAWGH